MKIFKEVSAIKDFLKSQKSEGKAIGFVPTMGALHKGHSSLIKKSFSENDLTVCSIFVNSLQFNSEKDLHNYPRNLKEDINFLSKINCDVLFAPSHEDIYPSSPKEKYDFGQLDKIMEGAFRPGHFNGVATVVGRFFDILSPTRAYFGMKDYQQLVIIKRLVELKNLNIEIVACETERNQDGLALSSRNALLSREDQLKAAKIHEWLARIKNEKGHQSLQSLKNEVKETIEHEEGFQLEYLEIADAKTLEIINKWNESSEYICCTAIYLGGVRLIDNILF